MGKYFSFHYSDKNLFYLILLYIVVYIIFNIVENITNNDDEENNDEDENNNQPFTMMNLLMESVGRSFYFIGDIIYNRHRLCSKDDYYKEKEKYNFNYKDIVTIITISFITLLEHFAEGLLELKRKTTDELEHLTFYLVFLVITKLMSKITYYRHQYFSIISFIILGLLRFIFEKIINDNLFTEKYYNLLIEIPLNLIINACKWISFIYFQKFMIDYYFSPYKIIFLFGLLNAFVILIIYLAVSFIPCKENTKNIFCSVYNKDQDRYYFDNIFVYFSNFEINDFLYSFVFCLLYPAYDAFIIYIIKIFPICYVFFPIQISFCIEIVQKILEFPNKENEVSELTIFVYIFTYIFEVIITLVFIEVLEVKLCGLNKYFKRNIRTRSLADVLSTVTPQRDTLDIETDEGYSIELGPNEEIEDEENIN